MDPREELAALRRMAELEAKASGTAGSPQPTESTAVAEPPAQSAQSASAGDIVAGLPATRMVAGLAAPVIGALQVGANIGDWITKKVGGDPVLGDYLAKKVGEYEAAKKRGMTALGETSTTDMLGAGGTLATGVVGLQGITPATTYLGKVVQGTAIGAGAGATTPTDIPGLSQTGKQATEGAALGGIIPAVAGPVAGAGKFAYRSFIEPRTNPGAMTGRAYLDAAGDKAPEILKALRSTDKQIVPGSMPTAGQAAAGTGRAEFAALQKGAEKVLPTEYAARGEVQKAAQLAQVRTVGQTKNALAGAEATRSANALTNWALANNQGIDQNMAMALQPQIESLMRRPSIEQARAAAVRLAAEKDISLTDFGTVEGLDWLKKGLDNQISAAAKATSAVGKADLGALMQTKSDLLATMKEIAPGYDVARSRFAADSVPINQMQVGQYLENKLIPNLGESGKLRANAFAGAVRDAPSTIQRALDNSPRFQELSQVLTPQQEAAVNSVVKDLARNAKFEELASKGASAAPDITGVASQSIEGAAGGKVPTVLNRTMMIANAIMNRVEGKMNKKLALEIAQEMLSPTQTANALKLAMRRAKTPIKDVLQANRVPLNALAIQAATSSRNQGQ